MSTEPGKGQKAETLQIRIIDALRADTMSSGTVCDHHDDGDEHSSSARTATDVSASTSPSGTPSDDMSSYQSMYMTTERTAEVFGFFMRNIYATFPVINFDNFTSQLNQDQENCDIEFRALAYALDMLHESYTYKLTPAGGTTKILSCMSRVEQIRCRYDYAEDPTANTVIVSFALFVAYNVLGRHQRALLYLLEASKLVEFTPMDSRIETMRIQRLKALLFITSSAATLLSAKSTWRVDVPSPLDVEDLISWYGGAEAPADHGASEDIRELDRFAVHQLQLMTRMHITARHRDSWDFLAEDHVANSASSVTLPATRMVRIVIADLSITQLWFSSDRQRLYDSVTYEDITKRCQPLNLAETTGRKALAWAKSLSQGELRIVGLGKMVDILENMVHLCSLDPSSTAEVEILARDLMAAISTADYEFTHAMTLARSAELLRHIASMYYGISCRPSISEATKHSDA